MLLRIFDEILFEQRFVIPQLLGLCLELVHEHSDLHFAPDQPSDFAYPCRVRFIRLDCELDGCDIGVGQVGTEAVYHVHEPLLVPLDDSGVAHFLLDERKAPA